MVPDNIPLLGCLQLLAALEKNLSHFSFFEAVHTKRVADSSQQLFVDDGSELKNPVDSVKIHAWDVNCGFSDDDGYADYLLLNK